MIYKSVFPLRLFYKPVGFMFAKFDCIHGNKQLIYGVMNVTAPVHLKLLLNLIIVQIEPQTQLMSSVIVCWISQTSCYN